MTDLQRVTDALRSAVDVGDLGAIADGVADLEQLAKPADVAHEVDKGRTESNINQPEIEQAITALFELLKDYPEVARITVRYSGNGDEGYVDDISCFDQDGNETESHDDVLNDLIDDLFYLVAPVGFELDEGGDGEIVVDVSAKTVQVHHNENVIHRESTTYEV